MSRRIVLRYVYYANTVNDFVIERFALIPKNDILKLLDSPYLLPECGDTFFMTYLFDNPDRGILYTARYGILSLFELFKHRYASCSDSARRCAMSACSKCCDTYKFTHIWPEVKHAQKRIRLLTAAAIGGNVVIFKQVYNIERKLSNIEWYEAIIHTLCYERDFILSFLFDKLQKKRIQVLFYMIREALDKNITTRMLIKLYQHVCIEIGFCHGRVIDRYLCVSRKHIGSYIDLLIEFGFRRVIKFYDITIHNDNTLRRDLNERTSYVHRINLVFIQALLNDEFVVPEDSDVIIYPLAIAVVCVSKKCSLALFHKFIDVILMASSMLSCDSLNKRIIAVLFHALSLVIESMEGSIDFNTTVYKYLESDPKSKLTI